MLSDHDKAAIKTRMEEWTERLLDQGSFPLLLVHVAPNSELRFLTTAFPGAMPVAQALEEAARRIRMEGN